MDLLRLITLYRYGGVNLDLDVIVQRTIEFIPLNFLGAQDNRTLSNDVLGITPLDPGHRFGKLLLLEFQRSYNPNSYIENNRANLITRVLSSFCNLYSIEDLIKKSQSCGFKVYNSSAFYPINLGNWQLFENPKYLNDMMNQTKDSYLVHFWNNSDNTKPIKLKDGSANAKLAQMNCPKTVAAAGEYF